MPDKTRQYSLTHGLRHDPQHRSKQQTDEIVQPSGNPVTAAARPAYNWTYAYGGAQPHAPTHIGDRTFTYDANGNQAGWTHDRNGTRRTIVWDEENRVQSIFDNGHETDLQVRRRRASASSSAGRRARPPMSTSIFTIRNRTIGTKHVYVGTTRLASKLMKPDGTVEKDQYFYHPDHLGSSNYVTDANGGIFEHLEYFPFGETWVEEATNTQRTPYLFTGKELDEETGLYYYGARYYDPRTSQFISADPLLVQQPAEVIRRPGLVGAFSYALNNPVMYTDPDGRDPKQSVKPILIVPGLPENPTMEDVRNALQTAIAARLAQGQSNSTGAKAPAAAPSQASGGKRDITPTEAQPLVEAAKFLASKNVPYAKRGRQSDLTSADCTGAVGMIYDMAGMHYEGVGGANVAGNADFKSKFRELGCRRETAGRGHHIVAE